MRLDMYFTIEGKFEGLIATPSGIFDDPYFPKPEPFRLGSAQARLG